MSFNRTFPYFLTSAAMFFSTGTPLSSSVKSSGGVMANKFVPTARVVNVHPDISPNDSHNADAKPVADVVIAEHVIQAIAHNKYDVVYTRANGKRFKRSGGTRAWRNNNPGCLRYSDFTKQLGAVGRAGGFAVFPDEETGERAIATLLRSDAYRNLTMAQAIYKYAPPHENNTRNYNARLRKMTGLSSSMRIRDMNDAQLAKVVQAIRVVEGWREGKEIAMTSIEMPKRETKRDTINFQDALRDTTTLIANNLAAQRTR